MMLSLTITQKGSKFSPIVFQGDYAIHIGAAAEIGFRAVELHIRDPKAVDRSGIVRALEERKMAVSTIGTGLAWVEERLAFTSPDGEVRRAAVQRIRDQIDFGGLLGAKVIIGTIKGPLPESEAEKPVARSRALTCLKECAEYAEKKGVPLSVEAINRYETNFLNTAVETAAFISEVGSDLVGMHLDTFHMNIEEVSIEETIRSHAKWLTHMHFADSNRWPPGKGHLDFGSVLRAMKEAGYGGYIGLECLPLPDPDSAARQAFNHTTRLLREMAGE
jgi:sugar phosphate isomerase/epimerase